MTTAYSSCHSPKETGALIFFFRANKKVIKKKIEPFELFKRSEGLRCCCC
jgi:hypothetical protein